MAFLTKQELSTVATQEVITLITNSDDNIITQIIAESIDLMKSYLPAQYDAHALFGKEGDERLLIVLKYLKDIVIHEIYIRRSKSFNEVAQARYNEAMLWLEKIAKGEISPDLPKKTTPQNASDTFLKLGSNPKYANR